MRRNGAIAVGSSGHKVAAALALLLPLLAVQPLGDAQAGAAASTINIVVRDAQTGDPVPNFLWMVTLDNSHDNASVTAPASYSPVVATGEVSDDSGVASGISLPNTVAPDRGYLVSVLVNDGTSDFADRYPTDYKIGGAHFRMPDNDGEVVVELQPHPLPLSTVRVRAFHDNLMVNSEDDIPLEEGLGDFHVTLADRVGEVTTDWFGNPICTQYQDLNGNGRFDPGDYDANGDPVPIEETGGFCVTDTDGVDADGDGFSDDGPDPDTMPDDGDGVPKGYAVIPNMGPDKYEVQVIPPDGESWIQTTTIEGTLAEDAWVEEGHDGFSTEEGFTQAAVWFGFVHECSFGNTADDCTSATADTGGRTGRINGRIRAISLDDESGIIKLGNPVPRPYVALNNIGGNDEQVYTARGNPDGTFSIPDVPAGLYQLVIWDLPLDIIIQFRTVRVTKDDCVGDLTACTVSMGDIAVPPWFGKIRGYAYIDDGIAANGTPIAGGNENGIRDCTNPADISTCERGLPNQDLDTRFKDGTIQYATFADNTGYYEFPEVFELEHFAIAEVGYGRFKQTGATGYETDDFGEPTNYPDGFVNQDLGLASLLQAQTTWAGTTNYIDWGKKPFAPGENGGIVGIVFNATTRNELDARLQAAEDYEPGVPGVPVNLYAAQVDANGDPVYGPDGEVAKDHLVAIYNDGNGADSWYDALPTDCRPRSSVGRTPGQIEPNGSPPGEPSLFPDCIELPALLQQIKSGVFDGGYAFEEDCSTPAATDPFDPNQLVGSCTPLAPGKYVVEIEPLDGYQPVREEDINVFGGDQLEPAVPPPPCAGPTHVVDVAAVAPDGPDAVYNPDFAATTSAVAPNGGSPFEGQEKPLCNARLIDLKSGFNANSDFFIFTQVPMPGRIRGVLLDDLVLELDPASPMYAEKRGIPFAPIGIRDFTGKLITTVYSDENGYWEVELPSTGTYNCALPAGPCPGMYQVVGNDPGSPQHPSEGWNPNYGTLKLTFDVWPGLTTYADVAILPITGFVQKPGPQFEPPIQCDIPAATPDLQEVTKVVGPVGTTFTIKGAGFGSTQGSGAALLDGTALTVSSWNDTSINVSIPSGVSPGPHQLLVRANNGKSSPLGITFHVTGAGYAPPQLDVGPGQAFATIQDALDAASDGALILVHPGVYYESVLIDEEVKLQGFGPNATVIDGRFFNFGGVSVGEFADKIAATAYDGPTTVPMGQVITVLSENNEFNVGGADAFNAQIDGFAIRGGTRVRGNRTAPSQGGGIYAHAYARHLEVSNNLIQSNAGNFGGGVILGRPYVTNPDAANARDNENDNVGIHYNRVLNNGGVSLAGALAIYNGANAFEINHNVICGNYSAEYGGGISNYGKSSGDIHDNNILYNFGFDEGGGIMIAGEEPPNPVTQISAGTGAINVDRNLIQGNVSNDDGGGIRLLTPVDGAIRIVNNMIVNNLATDNGGAISLDDALSVQIVNNAVAKNVSTATAEDADHTSCGPPPNGTCPHGAGLVSELHSAALMAARNPAKDFSDPALFNNIFWKNEAFYLDGNQVIIGYTPPSAGYIDFEVLDLDGDPGTRKFSGTYNVCTTFAPSCPNDGTNKEADPKFVQEMTLSFDVLAFGGDPSFVTVILKSSPGDPQGDYHIQNASPAVNQGTNQVGGVSAPTNDFDLEPRPQGGAFDIGADELPGAPGPAMHVGDLDGSAIGDRVTSRRSSIPPKWRAFATITVHDESHNPVPDATVTGTWNNPGDGTQTLSCTTAASQAAQTALTQSFPAEADTYASSAAPGDNFGTASILRTDGSPDIRSFLRFDPNGLGTITSATLKVYANSGNSVGIDVRGVTTNAWGETTLTYNNKPGVLAVTDSSGPISAGSWVEWDVKSLLSGNDPVSFALTSTSPTNTSLASRQTTNNPPTLPQLVVTSSSGSGASTCTVQSGKFQRTVPSATFTVSGVTHGTLSYQSGANHDPDGDSTGTAVTVNRP